LFDPQKDPPTLLRAGDRVRFRSITREEFAAFAEATAAQELLNG
jgi:allophanate hydrolase subunit 1